MTGARELLPAALGYAGRGWPVLPLKPSRKDPLTPHGVRDATTDPAQIRQWWTKWPDANVGIATGKHSGLVVLDVDPRSGGDRTLAEFEDCEGEMPMQCVVWTGGGGYH